MINDLSKHLGEGFVLEYNPEGREDTGDGELYTVISAKIPTKVISIIVFNNKEVLAVKLEVETIFYESDGCSHVFVYITVGEKELAFDEDFDHWVNGKEIRQFAAQSVRYFKEGFNNVDLTF